MKYKRKKRKKQKKEEKFFMRKIKLDKKQQLKQSKGISTRHNPSVSSKTATAGITLIALVITIVLNCSYLAMELIK